MLFYGLPDELGRRFDWLGLGFYPVKVFDKAGREHPVYPPVS